MSARTMRVRDMLAALRDMPADEPMFAVLPAEEGRPARVLTVLGVGRGQAPGAMMPSPICRLRLEEF